MKVNANMEFHIMWMSTGQDENEIERSSPFSGFRSRPNLDIEMLIASAICNLQDESLTSLRRQKCVHMT